MEHKEQAMTDTEILEWLNMNGMSIGKEGNQTYLTYLSLNKTISAVLDESLRSCVIVAATSELIKE